MKNKKYISGILIGLLSITGCFAEDTSSSNVSTSNTSVSDSTSDTKRENYFSANDTQLLENYFGFVVPSLNLEYQLDDYSSDYGFPCVVIFFDNATENDFVAYRNLLGEQFTFVEEGEYESDYWYIYEEGNCYDDYSDEIPFIYLQVYDASYMSDGGDSGGDTGSDDSYIKETVDGNFDEEDLALLSSYFDFEIPCVGNYYELYDYTENSLVDIYIFFNDTTETDFSNYLEKLDSIFTFDGNQSDDYGYTYYLYSIENYYIDVFYDNTENEPYIYFNIYDSSIEY